MAVTSKDLTPAAADLRRKRKLTFIETITPKWGREAAWWTVDEGSESGAWFIVSFVMTIIVLGIGTVMLFGDGYATIQAIRYSLRALGASSIRVDGIPAAPWWLIQVVLVIIQVFGKVVKGLMPLWMPSYVFNTITTGTFVGIAASNLLGLALGFADGALRPSDGTIICGIVGALLGHILAIGAEQVFMTGLCMVGGLFTALKR